MKRKGQTAGGGIGGYAMAALLVAIAVMGVAMSVLMPTWRHMVQREKEEELVFRGQQYVHAISLFQRKFAGAYPPDVDTLVKQKVLRKKYKDPIADDDFDLVYFGQQMQLPRGQGTQGQQAQPGQPGASESPAGRDTSAAGQRGQTSGSSSPSAASPAFGSSSSLGSSSSSGFTFDASSGRSTQSAFGQRPGGVVGARGGIVGVRSKSTDESIKEYKGRTHYNEWEFMWLPQQAGRPGTARPGARGGQTGPGDFLPGSSQPGPGNRGRGGQGGFDNQSPFQQFGPGAGGPRGGRPQAPQLPRGPGG